MARPGCVRVSATEPANWDAADPHQRAKDMRRAWEEFFVSGVVLPSVRPAIAESWVRSRKLGIPPSLRARPVERGLERILSSDLRQLLVRASGHVLDRLVEMTEGSTLTFTLTDADGLILVQRGSPRLLAHNEQIGVVRGTRWAELDVGTNGIGTALALRQTMRVFAAEHYCETFHETMCTASLVRHPLTFQPIGVFDITSRYAEPVANVWALATQAAMLIEREIQNQLTSTGERLLETLAARRIDQAAYAIDLEGRHTIANRGATAVLEPEDYSSLWPYIRESVQESDERVVPHVLKGGKSVLVEVNVVRLGDEPVGAVVVLRENRRTRRSSLRIRHSASNIEDWSPFKASAQWLLPARASLSSRGPVLIIGESGSGKTTVAAVLQRNAGGERLHVIDCASLDDWSQLQRLLDEADQCAVLIERLLDLQPGLQARLVGLLDDALHRTRVLATACVRDEAELRAGVLRQDLLDRLAVYVIRVPPLRERGDEIEEITSDALHELTHDRSHIAPPLTREALSILRTYSWPGNVRQLQNVLRRAVTVSPRGPIDVDDLPPEIVLGASESRLGLIEQLEGEAILRTLQSTAGNVSKAAQLMGLSRATIYRRLHAYRARGHAEPTGREFLTSH
jgi:sigma-54 dependent transcriptional regulator, acetoin dehydrogenase operon transcriptional activator AcoR